MHTDTSFIAAGLYFHLNVLYFDGFLNIELSVRMFIINAF